MSAAEDALPKLETAAMAHPSRCTCELRERVWNPCTGYCEACEHRYVDARPQAVGTPLLAELDAVRERLRDDADGDAYERTERAPGHDGDYGA